MFHPIISKRNRFFIYWLIWLIIGLGQSVLIIYTTELTVSTSFSDGFFSSIIFAVIALTLWFPVKQFSSGKNTIIIAIVNHLLMALIALALWMFLTRFLVLAMFTENDDYRSFWSDSLYYRIGAAAFMYTVIILTYYLMISVDNIAKKNMREAKLENMLKETELMMLRSQINPHFLFNSLNSISSLTISDSERAREMVIKLSDFMRYALSRKQDRTVTLETELENLRLYLDIEKVRFGEKLVLEENIEDECMPVKIPNMILQPLYENAIKHGVYESTEIVRIKLNARRTNAAIKISIVNNFDPESIPAGGTGTGLLNVSRRLELYYSDRAWLKTTKEDNIFTAELYIPEQTDIRS
ncbi:MAG TPA: histidine kinase [Bacteroidales bacterium]|nr:histidine kinase [Bacteroidales bacterium]